MKIAVVGAGISGLVAARLLHGEHELTVFEADRHLGGHSHTVRVDTEHETHWVDTGFIVFNDRNYPNFERLLAGLPGVEPQETTMSFSVKADHEDFEYSGSSLNGLFAQRRNLSRPAFWRMISDLARFNRGARRLLASDEQGPSLGEYLERERFSRAFIDRLIVPQAAAVWSADPHQMWTFPVRFLAEFFANHGMLSFTGRPVWRTIKEGSRRYVEALAQPFRHRIRLASPVQSVTRGDGHVELAWAGGHERFDEVILATHSDQALNLLSDPTERERELLGSIPYQPNEAVLHTDHTVLPRRRRAWASWNYHLLERPSGRSTVTYWMNSLQRLRADRQFCVTLNHTERIDPAKIIARIPYAHPVYDQAGVDAQSRHATISGRNRTHYCGAYWGAGFHEDGVVSALRVCERFGARL